MRKRPRSSFSELLPLEGQQLGFLDEIEKRFTMHITTASYSMTLRAQCAQDIFFFDCGLRAWDVTGTEDTNDSASRSTLIPDVNGHNGRSLVILSGITSSVSTWFRIVILTGVSTLWLYSALPLMLDSRRERASPTRTSRHTPFTRADLGTLTRLVVS